MTRNELKSIIEKDAAFYNSYSKKAHIKMILTNSHFYVINKYMRLLRYEEYYRKKSAGGGLHVFNKVMEFIYSRKKNKLGNTLGFYINPNTLGAGTIIYHHGSIIINTDAVVGCGCKLHGNNCIGNDGVSLKAPHIGNNVEIGFGASIIGDVTIADDVKIGAGAVVVKSCLKKGASLVGVPAKEV